jgi:ketosteroid isomerase-like protein
MPRGLLSTTTVALRAVAPSLALASAASDRAELRKLLDDEIDGDVAWLSADLSLYDHIEYGGDRQIPVRMTALATRDDGSWTFRAIHYSEPSTLAHSLAEQARGPLRVDPLPSSGTPRTPLIDHLEQPVALARDIRPGKEVIVLGTGASERAVGAKASPLLARWKSVKLAINGPWHEEQGARWRFVAARLRSPVTPRGKPTVTLDYRVLVIAVAAPDGGWKVVSAHFADERATDDWPGSGPR